MRAFVLWTGGKDCCLALHQANKSGIEILGLVTFVPEVGDFFAHPMTMIKLQAQALCLPQLKVRIGEPYKENYQRAITAFRKQYSVDCLVTGDIDLIDGQPNWIQECAQGTGVHVVTPLWKKPRDLLLEMILQFKLDVRISCLRADVTEFMPDSWINRKWDSECITELRNLQAQHEFDACGENGEYHSLVMDGPMFQQRISIDRFSIKNAESEGDRYGGVRYMNIAKAGLVRKF